MLYVALFALLFIVFPLRYSFPVDSETDADAPVIDYVDDDPSLPKQPGKQTLLAHSNIAHFFPSHACIGTATAFCMILL